MATNKNVNMLSVNNQFYPLTLYGGYDFFNTRLPHK